jgi:hypothetical protein
MPLFDDANIHDEPPVIQQPVLIEKPLVQSNVVDTRYTPRQNLLAYIEGSPWRVNYYSQVLAGDSEISPQQSSMPAPYQQYRLIRGFELRVTDALTSSQNDDEKIMEQRGGANVYPCLIPNQGDMFVADTGDGRAFVFQVLTSERKSVYKESIFTITYVSAKQLTDVSLADLESRTVERLNFVRDFLVYGRSPFITDEESRALDNITKFYNLSTMTYMTEFLYNETKSLLVPDPTTKLYDHFISTLLSELITVHDTYHCRDVRVLNCSGSKRMKSLTVFDAVLVRSKELLNKCVWKVAISSPTTFDRSPRLYGIYYCPIDGIVVPKTIGEHLVEPGNGQGLPGNTVFSRDNDFYTGTLTTSSGATVPLIKSVLVDDFYILSEAFYRDDRPNMSILERMVMDLIEEKPLDFIQLSLLVVDSYKWGRIETFYYLPFLFLLVKSVEFGS